MDHGRCDLSARHRTIGLVLDAIDIVLHRLEGLRPSPDVDAVRVTAMSRLREAQAWERDWPSLEAQEHLMKRVLDIHARAARLETSSGNRAPRVAPAQRACADPFRTAGERHDNTLRHRGCTK